MARVPIHLARMAGVPRTSTTGGPRSASEEAAVGVPLPAQPVRPRRFRGLVVTPVRRTARRLLFVWRRHPA